MRILVAVVCLQLLNGVSCLTADLCDSFCPQSRDR